MATCRNCKYCHIGNMQTKEKSVEIGCCSLTHHVIKPDVESDCKCFNKDLSEYDICYNCKYYGGGGDWGLFCSHKDMYHHLGKFSDAPCKRYERRTDG